MKNITLKLFICSLLAAMLMQSCVVNYRYPSGSVFRKYSLEKYDTLKHHLQVGEFREVKNDFFGQANDITLPDVICYIPENSTNAIIGMPGKRKLKKLWENNPTLWNKKKMWVIVFSKKPMVMRDTNKDIAKRVSNAYQITTHDTLVAFPDSVGHHLDNVIKVHARATHYLFSQQIDSSSLGTTYLNLKPLTLSTTTHTIRIDTVTANTPTKMATPPKKTADSKPIANNNTNVSITATVGAPTGPTTTVKANSSTPQSDNGNSTLPLAIPKTFVDHDITTILKKRPNDSLTIKRSLLEYSPQPGLNSFDGLIKAFASLFTKATSLPTDYAGSGLKDTTIVAARGKISLILPNTTNDTIYDLVGTPCYHKTLPQFADTIYEYMVGIPLALNSVNRIVITPPGDSNISFIDYTFGNYESTRISAGVGLGVNFNPDNPFNDLGIKGLHKITSQQVDPSDFAKLYMFVHYYILRPQLPQYLRSIALVVGTNISGNLFNDFVTGVGFYHGNGGIIIADNYLMYNSVRRVDAMIGLEYKF